MDAQDSKKSHLCDFKGQQMSHKCDVLTELQQRAINLLLQERTQEEVAEEIGVTRESINRWLNRNHAFIIVLNERREQLQVEATELLKSLQQAVELIEQVLSNTRCMENLEVKSAFNKIKTLVLTVKTEREQVVLDLPKRRSRTSLASKKLNSRSRAC